MGKKPFRRIGILTSGGDCPGLNAAIRGVAKPAQGIYGMEVLGIRNGFKGLIDGEIKPLLPKDVSGILTIGGTILGTTREKPFKVKEENGKNDKIEAIKANYTKFGLDCIVVLGGNGSQKTAAQLKAEGLNVVGLPKTIDNDIYGTDVTFGFHTAVEIATDAVDRLHSTAHSHNRVMVVEVMGHDAGWLALYAGVAGGGDVILLPEIPYNIDSIAKHLKRRAKSGKDFSIVVVAEGAISEEEAKLTKKQLKEKREREKRPAISYRVAEEIQSKTDLDVRVSVLGYLQRGGAPSPYDRIIATQFGTAAAALLYRGNFGNMVTMENNIVVAKPLEEISGKLKTVPADHPLIGDARLVGTCFGDD